MKKLLVLLLSFLIVGMLVSSIFNMSKEENPNIPSSTPTAETQEPPLTKVNYAPIEVDNTTGFETSWYTGASDANVNLQASYNEKVINIEYPGTTLESATFFREGIPFKKGDDYIIVFDIESSVQRNVELILKNADSQEILYKQPIAIGENKQIRVEFNMDKETCWNGEFLLNIGNDGQEVTSSYHTITIRNLNIVNATDSDNSIKVNHIGYRINDQKQAVFPYSQGDSFNVIDVNTGAVVYTGAIKNKVSNSKTGEMNFIGDFTNVMTPGKYRIESQICGTSFEFEIGDHVFKTVATDLLKMLTIQRCGYDLSTDYIGDLAHASCHHTDALIYGTDQIISVRGGWHDAGDYGRYVETGVKTLSDLLFGYMANSAYFEDNLAIPESGNGISDILDEAKYELDWLLKMQTSWGEIYSKVVTPSFAGDIIPEQDNQQLYVVGSSTTTTADFVAIMALASQIYADVDPDFSNKCLEAAKLSWDYLLSSVNNGEIKNPEDIQAGEYRDSKDSDERFYAAIAMWSVTQDKLYLDIAKEVYNQDNTSAQGLSWKDIGGFGRYLYLVNENAKNDKEFYELMKTSLVNDANVLQGIAYSDGYSTALEHYSWGSNGSIADNGILLSMAYNITNEMSYRQLAIEQVNYLLGKNVLNRSYVVGYGQNSPTNMHSRLAKAKNTILKGALVGGANSDRDDALLNELGENTPAAKMYLDRYNSYSTNEVSIYWNSGLLHLILSLD
ncbi:glycoside hydrolase family 9 protein [Anaerorhabdus furcosa]|uniref:Endoglucanase n=1 Tax=Anaerorhabdus furcosa TaxID=118967 RepID=A0A1T4LSD4_9FIRM|nr:glycoside hydrolase family 9 protein [Anaerorhabdus furcosa]SJZ57649.1 endoglucanase [Anaerorhabdus furcosa]